VHAGCVSRVARLRAQNALASKRARVFSPYRGGPTPPPPSGSVGAASETCERSWGKFGYGRGCGGKLPFSMPATLLGCLGVPHYRVERSKLGSAIRARVRFRQGMHKFQTRIECARSMAAWMSSFASRLPSSLTAACAARTSLARRRATERRGFSASSLPRGRAAALIARRAPLWRLDERRSSGSFILVSLSKLKSVPANVGAADQYLMSDRRLC